MTEQLYKHQVLKKLYTSYYGERNKDVNLPQSMVQSNLLSAFFNYVYSPFSELWRYDYFGHWVAKHLSDEDVVISWGLSALPVIERAHKLGIGVIVERGSAHAVVQRDLLIEEYESYGQSTEKLRRSFSAQRMERELLEYDLADYIEVPSEFAKRSFLEQGVPESKIIRGFRGVNLSLFHELPTPDSVFRVIYTGQMSLQKGVHYLLKAFVELSLPNAELWLFGSKTPEIIPFFERYSGHYRHFGPVPQRDLHKYYAYGSVFALCSIQEGMAQVQPQAMACGLPLICTTNTGGEDLITDGVEGFVIPIRDVDAIKEKILYLYENPNVCYEMGQAAKRKVQQGLTWDDYGRFLIEKYTALIGREK
jgi:glycosyltransferase involved in cell wall biosynthesis